MIKFNEQSLVRYFSQPPLSTHLKGAIFKETPLAQYFSQLPLPTELPKLQCSRKKSFSASSNHLCPPDHRTGNAGSSIKIFGVVLSQYLLTLGYRCFTVQGVVFCREFLSGLRVQLSSRSSPYPSTLFNLPPPTITSGRRILPSSHKTGFYKMSFHLFICMYAAIERLSKVNNYNRNKNFFYILLVTIEIKLCSITMQKANKTNNIKFLNYLYIKIINKMSVLKIVRCSLLRLINLRLSRIEPKCISVTINSIR